MDRIIPARLRNNGKVVYKIKLSPESETYKILRVLIKIMNWKFLFSLREYFKKNKSIRRKWILWPVPLMFVLVLIIS